MLRKEKEVQSMEYRRERGESRQEGEMKPRIVPLLAINITTTQKTSTLQSTYANVFVLATGLLCIIFGFQMHVHFSVIACEAGTAFFGIAMPKYIGAHTGILPPSCRWEMDEGCVCKQSAALVPVQPSGFNIDSKKSTTARFCQWRTGKN